MKSFSLPLASIIAVATASCPFSGQAVQDDHDWQPPAVDAVRGPCPMLNSLANHGYLPRDGKNIDLNTTINALGSALNIDEELAEFLYDEAITTAPSYPNATVFSLANLVTHNILEHDASLSRVDYYFGDPQPFNETIFNQTRSYWTDDIINVTMAANARYARVQTSNDTNPTYSLSELGEEFGYGESAAYIGILGDKTSGTVQKKIVEYLFVPALVTDQAGNDKLTWKRTENERLPTEFGWSRLNETFSTGDLEDLMQRIMELTPGATVMPANETTVARRGRIHNASKFFH